MGSIGIILLIIWLALFYIAPAVASRDRLEKLSKKERPKDCIAQPYDDVPRPITGGQQSQEQGKAIPGAEAAQNQNKKDEVATCLSGEQIAVASRANVIAIEAATATVAGVFIAFLAAVISILALVLASLGSRKVDDTHLAFEFVPNAIGGDEGIFRIHNRGTVGVLLDSVVVNGADVVRSASSDGLVEIEVARASDHSIVLVDRGGSRCIVDYKTLRGDVHEIVVQLKRNAGRWHVVDVKKHR